jgi:hypothetical protein
VLGYLLYFEFTALKVTISGGTLKPARACSNRLHIDIQAILLHLTLKKPLVRSVLNIADKSVGLHLEGLDIGAQK